MKYHKEKNKIFVLSLAFMGLTVSELMADTVPSSQVEILSQNIIYAEASAASYNDDLFASIPTQTSNPSLLTGAGSLDSPSNKPFVSAKSISINGEKWSVVSSVKGSSGFAAIAIKRGNEIVVAYRGTDGAIDFATNVQLILPTFSLKQYTQAIEFINRVQSSYETANITVTGHSLGGSIAQLISLGVGYPAVTYNAAPINVPLKSLGISSDVATSRDILNIRRDSDFVSKYVGGAAFSYGEDLIIDLGDCNGAFCEHSMSSLVGFSRDALDGVIYLPEPAINLIQPASGAGSLFYGTITPSLPAFSGAVATDLEPKEWRAPDLTDDRQAEIIDEAQPVDPPPTAAWAGRMSLSGRYTIGLNPATGIVEAMEASGDAPVNNFILFNPDAGTMSQPLRGLQSTDGIGHSFNHLIWGNWSGGSRVWEDNSDQPVAELSGFFVYGELTPATARTSGSATYTGRLRGDVIEEGGAIHRGLAYGDFGLTANFGTGALGGWLAIAGEDSTDYVFVTDITDARIVRQSDRLAFYGDLGSNYDDASGSIEGYFYGTNATELGGTYEVTNTNGEGSSHGILLGWETGTMPDRPADPENSLAIVVGYDSSANSHGTAWNEGSATGSVISYNDSSDTVESVTKTTTFAAGGYSYVSWGSWAANDTTREELGPNGTWVDVTSVTPASVIASKTGTAEYSGNIAGGYVSYGGVREDARGLINITADFSDQSVSGEFQFGRGCGGSGSGPSGCNTISSVETFDEPINDYDGSGFGNHTGGLSGVVGVFGGPNGEEIGGTAWLTEDNGQYIGVFRADQ